METSMYYNEYIISSNNSINENTLNTEKLKRSSSYRLKKMLKPLIKMIKQNSSSKKESTQKLTTTKKVCKCKHYSYEEEDYERHDDIYDYTAEIDDNQFNEDLEERIIDEIKSCDDNSAIYVYDSYNNLNLTPVYNDEIYVPVHFARTANGTFFWTTMQRPVDCDLVESKNCQSDSQLPQLQQHSYDRWVQA
jgi:hypothetical protein